MAASTYKAFIDRVIQRYEGGYSWNKKDTGGPTKYGITCYDLAEHMGQKMTSMAAWAPKVQAMSLATAEEIYRSKYAKGVNYDALPPGVDTCTLDYAINSGVSRALLVAKSLADVTDPIKFIDAMCDERLRFMHGIRGGTAWAEFGHGWQARVDDLRKYSKALVTASTAPAAPDLTLVNMPKATHAPESASGTTAGGVVAGAGAAYAAGLPWYYIVGIAAAILFAGIAYEAVQDAKAKSANNTVGTAA